MLEDAWAVPDDEANSDCETERLAEADTDPEAGSLAVDVAVPLDWTAWLSGISLDVWTTVVKKVELPEVVRNVDEETTGAAVEVWGEPEDETEPIACDEKSLDEGPPEAGASEEDASDCGSTDAD